MPGTLDKYKAVDESAQEWKDGEELADEGNWDGEWEEGELDEYGDEWDEDEYDDEEDDYAILEALDVGSSIKRPIMGGPNRVKSAGIHTIEIYYPQYYIRQTEMEEYDARPDRYGPSVIGKYTKGIGQIEARLPTDDEDPVSFAMTSVHRLLERMDKEGWNETGRWSDDGKTLPIWESIGRLDIGSESLVDRSKSIKSCVMDIFERYGGNTGNIEGVDQYNACYGGQAAGLAVLSWLESDRWDGRYGIACGDDISEAHSIGIAYVGASCSAALFYPNAPLAHHSLRASCILHRWDFFKPVGWHSMAPLSDGKYSIDAYMTAIDVCYQGLRKKMNNKPLLSLVDYNVFHTGGGYHVVKKAFLRMCQSDDPQSNKAQREAKLEVMLMPSVHLLKRIGPCHTSSSFLNTASVCMSQYDKAIGKHLMVFTYGSGCAATMYQTRFEDIPWLPPLGIWMANFYRKAIHVQPEMAAALQEYYCHTWMQFEWEPMGRKKCGFGIESYEEDAYYVITCDTWGRRSYHRGGMKAKPHEARYKLMADREEFRKQRDEFPLPPAVTAETKQPKAKPLQERWKDIEFEMTQPEELEEETVVTDTRDKLQSDSKIKVLYKQAAAKPEKFGLPDNTKHGYSIVGSWSSWEPVKMTAKGDGSFEYKVVIGENGWEEFYLLQDGLANKRIYPAQAKSWKSLPCIGPHDGGDGLRWLIDTRDKPHVPQEDFGSPGDVFLITFSWSKDSVKELVWVKLEETQEYPRGQYFIVGPFTCWDPMPFREIEDGRHSLELQITSFGLDFHLLRNQDPLQVIYPEAEPSQVVTDATSRILGPMEVPKADNPPMWSVLGEVGEVVRIDFYRDPSDPDDLDLSWESIGKKEIVEPNPRYFAVGTFCAWNARKSVELLPMDGSPGSYSGAIPMRNKTEEFYIVLNRSSSKAISPDRENCTQFQLHSVIGPQERRGEESWSIGRAAADKAKVGDEFTIQFDAKDKKVSWSKPK